MTIFRDFRRLVEAVEQLAGMLQEVAAVLKDLRQMQDEAGPALDRVAALELSRHHFEAEIQGVLLKAEGKLKAAANAEARERQLKRSYESRIDDIDPHGDPASEVEAVLGDDAPRSEAPGVQPLRLDVAPPNSKALALKAKWG